jgi:RNA polymerase sigma factor (sigma-70 family)
MVEVSAAIREKTAAALSGDAAALGALFQWYRPRLHAHALRICGNTPSAQDAVQDTFISAFTHLSTLRDPSSFYPWLKRILVNTCYKLLRKEKFISPDDRLERRDLLVQASIDAHFEKISNQQRVHEGLRFLSEELRSCVMLRYFSSYSSYDDIARLLGIPVGTVRSRLAAAREKLHAIYSSHEDASEAAAKLSATWSHYYRQQWLGLYDDAQTRNVLFEHFSPSLLIRFTSGKAGQGRSILEKEIDNDLRFGSRFTISNVVSSGNLSVLEGPNFNHPDHPDRCAPHTAMVVIRDGDRAESVQIFDSARTARRD